VGDDPESRIVPACPVTVANACVKETVPKFASGNGVQSPLESQDEGASAIHSADDKSGVAMRNFLMKFVRRVRFLIWSDTWVPLTLTDAVTTFPGKILYFTLTLGAGTSSYHIE
jgi:hypothetical protein